VPFPVPEGVTEHQVSADIAVHAEFEVTAKLVFPAGYVTFWLAGVTERVGERPY